VAGFESATGQDALGALRDSLRRKEDQGMEHEVVQREKVLYCQRTGPYDLDGFIRPALRHGSSNSLFPCSLIFTLL
jgi:hypothetical protein